jgi:hypothetical protein
VVSKRLYEASYFVAEIYHDDEDGHDDLVVIAVGENIC